MPITSMPRRSAGAPDRRRGALRTAAPPHRWNLDDGQGSMYMLSHHHGLVSGLLVSLLHGLAWSAGWMIARGLGLPAALALLGLVAVGWLIFSAWRSRRRPAALYSGSHGEQDGAGPGRGVGHRGGW